MPSKGTSRNPWSWTVLALLHERPMHPYEIAQLTRERGKDQLAAHKPGSLYSVIERLRGEELIEAVHTDRDGRLPERTTYRITEAGRSALLTWLHDELGGLDERDLPRFGFAVEKIAHLSPATATYLLEARARHVQEQLGTLDRILASGGERDVPPVSLLEIDYVRTLRGAELDWLHRVLDDLRTGRLRWSSLPDRLSEEAR